MMYNVYYYLQIMIFRRLFQSQHPWLNELIKRSSTIMVEFKGLTLNPFSAGTVFIRQNLTSVVCKRHVLTYKDAPYTAIINTKTSRCAKTFMKKYSTL